MKKFSLSLFLILVIIFIFADCPIDSLWEQIYGGSGDQYILFADENTEGHYICAGITEDSSAGQNDVYLFETDSLGNMLWHQIYGGSSYDYGKEIIEWPNGDYYVLAYTASLGAGSYDAWLMRTDSVGDTLWTELYGTSSSDLMTDFLVTSDSTFMYCGYSGGVGDFWFMETDTLGNILWNKVYVAGNYDRLTSICITDDGNYLSVGITKSFGAGEWDGIIFKIDSIGDTLWMKTYGGPDDDGFNKIISIGNDQYIIAGYTSSGGRGAKDGWIMTINGNGDSLWAEAYGGASDDNLLDIMKDGDEYIAVGSTASVGSGGNDKWIIKVDSIGDSLWSRYYGTYSNDEIRSIVNTSHGAYLTGGMFYSATSAFDGELMLFDTLWADAFSVISPADDTFRFLPDTFLWNSSDAANGLSEYKIIIDDSIVLETGNTDTVYSAFTDTLPLGYHSWYAQAVNTYDNPRTSMNTLSFILDYEPPEVFDLTLPEDRGYANNMTVYLDWQSAIDSIIGMDYYQIEVASDSLFTSIIQDTQCSVSEITLPLGVSDISVYWRVRAFDRFGNERMCNDYFSFEIDTTMPATVTLISPSDSSYFSYHTLNYSWTSSSKAAPVYYQIEIDTNPSFPGPLSTHTTANTNINLYNNSVGYYYWRVASVDSGGNTDGYSPVFIYCIDIQAPDIISFTGYNDTTYKGPFPINAIVKDDYSGNSAVYLHYKTPDDTLWYQSAMHMIDDTSFIDSIPLVTYTGSVYYYLHAVDNASPANVSANSSVKTFMIENNSGITDNIGALSLHMDVKGVNREAVFYLTGDISDNASLNIYDVAGRQIYRKNLMNTKQYGNGIHVTLPSAGVYFIQIINNETQINRQFVIIE